MRLAPTLLSLVMVATAIAPAHADYLHAATAFLGRVRADYGDYVEQAAELAGKAAVSTINRKRRSIAIGTQAGYFGGASNDGRGQAGLSFGISLYTFELPAIEDRIVARLLVRVKERIEQLAATGRIGNPKEIAKQLVDDVVREVTAEVKPSLLEKPQLKVVLEGALLQAPRGFQTRAVVGYGISYLCVGVHGGLQRSDDNTLALVGPELSVHLTPIGKLRTPVIDVFARGDIRFDDAGRSLAIVGGARLALDVL